MPAIYAENLPRLQPSFSNPMMPTPMPWRTALTILLLSTCFLPAQEETAPAASPIRTVLLPKSLRTPLSVPVVDGAWAHAAPARLRGAQPGDTALDDPNDLELLKEADDPKALLREGAEYLKALLIKQPVEYFRDRHELVEYAAINGEDPCIAALILLPEFFARYEPVFGPEFRVVAPNQFTLFLFPKDGTLDEFTRPLADAYRESPHPVSLEVFEVSKDGIRVVGELPR